MHIRGIIRRGVLAGAALAAAASGWAVGTGSPAGADVVIQGCWKPGRWVVFEDINYNWWGTSAANMNCWEPGVRLNMPSNMNDRVSSIENNTDKAACFWEHANQQGHFLRVGTGQIADLTKYSFPSGGTWNDRISSVSQC